MFLITDENKKWLSLHDKPALAIFGHFNVGDIVWNKNPEPGFFIGWVCIEEGTPGIWKGFGRLEE